MKKFVYMTQDMVSHATSELFTAENDDTVIRMIKAQVVNTDPAQYYLVKDSTVFKLGMIVIDDDTGEIKLHAYNLPSIVCRAGSFAYGADGEEVIPHNAMD